MKIEMGQMRCALVALVGLPNAGKSTLINALVGEKVGIVSPKPNTTRLAVRGVVTEGANQLIFMDTPGLNRSSKAFDRRLVQQATGSFQEADIVVFLVDVGRMKKAATSGAGAATGGSGGALAEARDMLKRLRAPLGDGEGRQKVVICLTKIDCLKDKKVLLPLLQEINGWGADAVVPLSAMKGSNLAGLMDELVRMAPVGPWLFPAGQVTDMPLPLRLAELTREKAMKLLHEEIPYTIGVVTQMVEGVRVAPDGAGFDVTGEAEGDEAPALVQQELLVAKEQHKAMVLGAKGQMLKKIGMTARKDMQELLGCGVRLELHVKVAERWMEREEWLREMGI